MKVITKIFYTHDGKMSLIYNDEKTCNKLKASQIIRRWYRKNQYAKRVDKEWICSDYRVDQQRPQRNVYSEAYIQITSMTEMEETYIDTTIKSLEMNREYPTVWDDGKNEYYEETIYCPNCGKRRKVLTSKEHCEFCGFEFSKAKKCPKCNSLNLKGSNYCIKCNYEFRKKSFINNDDFEVKKKEKNDVVKCPICNKNKSEYFDTCQNCGFDFTKNKQCPKCKKWINNEDKYCGYCGQKLKVFVECKNCGKKNDNENRFCTGCGKKIRLRRKKYELG